MYKIPENFDIQGVKNEVISQITFSLNVISLHFGKGFIQFSGAFSMLYNDGQKVTYEEVYPVYNDYKLLELLEKKINEISTNERRTDLIITFEGNNVLCLNGDENYESYLINIDGKEIRV